MKVLVACEFSGTVRDAFSHLGHDAWSCDLLPSETPGNHIQGDVAQVIGGGFDLMIAHPPCTYLCSSGMHWTTRGHRDPKLTEDALAFVHLLMEAPIPLIAVENPNGVIGTRIRPWDQFVQPYHFGHDASKKTGLWLKGLPLVTGTKYVPPRLVCKRCKAVFYQQCGDKPCRNCDLNGQWFMMRWANQTDSGQNRLTPSERRWAERSKTYSGIAEAMANQWGNVTPK